MNHCIRCLSLGTQKVSVLIGLPSSSGYEIDGLAGTKLNKPRGLALDKEGHLIIADSGNNRILSADILSKDPKMQIRCIGNGKQGYEDGIAETAMFKKPYSVCVDELGIIYVADNRDHRIRRVST
jgi:hypothetical protein